MLSELGQKQCEELGENLRKTLPSIGKVGLIVASPMKRTLQTAQLALDWLIESDVPFQASADWQGACSSPTGVHRPSG